MTHNILTFVIDKLVCAVPITSVLEVIDYTAPTMLPCAEPFIEGLVYSREQGVTVVNLRKRFELKPAPANKNTRIIVIEKKASADTSSSAISLFGAVADSVNDVIEAEIDSLLPVSKKKEPFAGKFITGMYKIDEQSIYLLNVDSVFETTALA